MCQKNGVKIGNILILKTCNFFCREKKQNEKKRSKIWSQGITLAKNAEFVKSISQQKFKQPQKKKQKPKKITPISPKHKKKRHYNPCTPTSMLEMELEP